MHSAWARTQLVHGFCWSQRTLRCWHRAQEWPRVRVMAALWSMIVNRWFGVSGRREEKWPFGPEAIVVVAEP